MSKCRPSRSKTAPPYITWPHSKGRNTRPGQPSSSKGQGRSLLGSRRRSPSRCRDESPHEPWIRRGSLPRRWGVVGTRRRPISMNSSSVTRNMVPGEHPGLPTSPVLGDPLRALGDALAQRRRPNSLSPVSPSRWSGHAHTRNQRSPLGVSHRPVHEGGSSQWVWPVTGGCRPSASIGPVRR